MNSQYRSLLEPYLAIPSISTNDEYHSEIQTAAEFLEDLFSSKGFDAQLVAGYGNPILFAEYTVSEESPTCLLYGHYDVQPAAKEEGWATEPFVLSERNGRLYGRGVADNKGQFLIHAVSLFELIAEGRLAYNVKILVEGNEESGSSELPRFLEEHLEMVQADFILVSDGEVQGDSPSLTASFRGCFNALLTVTTSSQDLHSGLFGGIMPNAIQELTAVLGGLYDAEHRLAIPGIYEGTVAAKESPAADSEKEDLRKLAGTAAVLTWPGVSPHDQLGSFPSLEVVSITGGYQGVGYRNSIPKVATAKFNIRSAPAVNTEQMAAKVKNYFEQAFPDYVQVEFEIDQISQGVALDIESKYAAYAIDLLRDIWNTEPVTEHCGASVPIVTTFAELLQIPQVLVGLANQDCGMHAANENFTLECIERGLEFSRRFFSDAVS